jgi:hypothetical protein
VLIPMLRTLWLMRLIRIDPVIDKNTVAMFPWYQWIKLSHEQKDKHIAEHQKERINSSNGKLRTPYPPRQANAHEVFDIVDIDNIIDYTMLNHDMNVDDDDDKGNTTDGDGLLAYITGRSSSAGDIRKVMPPKTDTIRTGKGP